MEIRKVQRVGHSTLTVSLPRDWVRQVGLKQGGVVTLRLSEFGELIVTPGSEIEAEEMTVCKINADACKDNELLARIITGNYILGRDTTIISSSKELTQGQIDEIRNSTRRLSGLGIVEQTPKEAVIQCFLDPSKFPITGLLTRLHKVAVSMLETAIQALMDRKFSLALEVLELENEADRLYWLILRQIFRAIAKIPLSRHVGMESATHAVGYRAVSKYLEEIADCSESIANLIISMADEKYAQYSSVIDEICKFGVETLSVSNGSMDSFTMLDLELANRMVDRSKHVEDTEKNLNELIVSGVQDRKLAVALKGIVWNLAQIARASQMVSEVAMNRYLENNTDICQFWKERKGGGDVQYLKKVVA
ncbi:MAG TPA: phosphate uptake regulator PhoU [Candidatus Acidoferrales bacterium]|nr:phosphate uptake regulator PhoU [Candidatus Acidoferrales bacterium]